MHSKFFVLAVLGFFVLVALAEEAVKEEESNNTEDTALSNFQFPGDFTLSEGLLRAVSVAGALVTGVAGLAALLSFLLPVMGFRTCSILGTCEEPTAYSQTGNSVYDNPQGFSGYQNNYGFKRRSLEYVGPILKALSTAYEKYGPPAQQRKLTPKSDEK